MNDLHLKLQTQAGVAQAIATLTDVARKLVGIISAETLNAVERERETLVQLAEQLRTGDYIVLDPDLSGWRYVATYFPEGARRERSLAFDKVKGVAELALGLNLPVVIGGEVEQWREQTASRLRTLGVVAITEMEGRD